MSRSPPLADSGVSLLTATKDRSYRAIFLSALPAGVRYYNGNYINLGNQGAWWSSTALGTDNAWYRTIFYSSGSIEKSADDKNIGISIRCIKE